MKLVLAAAMWNNPHLLIMDEPTNYLDRVRDGGGKGGRDAEVCFADRAGVFWTR